MRASGWLALILALAAPIARAEPATAPPASDRPLERAVEMPAHRALMRVRAAPGTQLAPFSTDGCSGGLSAVWTTVADSLPRFAETHRDAPPWEACCVTHDRRYHNADGANLPDASFAARLAADEALRRCVLATGEARQSALAAEYGVDPARIRFAYATIADAMFLAVRFGGGPCSGLPWRWGYGYPGCSVLRPAPDDQGR